MRSGFSRVQRAPSSKSLAGRANSDHPSELQPQGAMCHGRMGPMSDGSCQAAKRDRRRPVARVRIRGARLELVFKGRFTSEDLAVVKGIPGRRWDPSLRCWLLPAGSDTLERLKRSYGHRLVVLGEGAVEKGQAGA